ncbi:MAG: hypothetical protein WA655_12040 [Candidatus Korobacteraceae bacterium]
MAKSDPIEKALNRLGELQRAEMSEPVAQEVRGYLGNRSNLVVAKAAKITAELQVRKLTPDLVAAFHRFMANPQQLDKRCAAITEIVSALYEFDYLEPEVYLQGLRHIQKEGFLRPAGRYCGGVAGECRRRVWREAATATLCRRSCHCWSIPSRPRGLAQFARRRPIETEFMQSRDFSAACRALSMKPRG